MSENIHKNGFRVLIRSLKGKSKDDALEYFRSVLGEPDEIDEWNGKIEYFNYNGKYQPRQEFSYKSGNKNENWVVDYVLSEGPEHENSEFYINLIDMTENIKELAQKFNVNENDIILFSYTWYNGADEPVEINF